MAYKVIHPRKMLQYCKDFIECATSYQGTYLMFPMQEENYNYHYNRICGIPFDITNAKKITGCSVTVNIYFAQKNKSNHIVLYDLNSDKIEIYIDKDDFLLGKKAEVKEQIKTFRQNFESRCPMAKGFANITLTLLHELEHYETYYTRNHEEDDKEKEEVWKHPWSEVNYYYFRTSEEMAATDWAIEWLQNSENRKLAKQFEKLFFSCIKR